MHNFETLRDGGSCPSIFTLYTAFIRGTIDISIAVAHFLKPA